MTVAKAVLPAAAEPSLWRWMIAAATVVLIHAAIVLWLIYLCEANTSAGEPPAAVMIELASLAVAPPSDAPPEITPGPQMKQAEPEKVEPQQTIAVPALPPAKKPAAVLMTAPKPKPTLPKKAAKKVEKPERELPAPRTSTNPQ